MTVTTKDYASLRDEATAQLRQGDLDAASTTFKGAYELARELGDQDIEDRALCNWVGVLISLERCDSQLPRLRQVLTRNSNLDNCYLAAYNLAHAYEEKREYKKGLFYARIALEHAQNLGTQEWVASNHNLLGNLLVAECYFQEALDHYGCALSHQPDCPGVLRGMLLGNIGYCHLMMDDLGQALPLLYRSLRRLRGHRLASIQARLDLSLALLEVGKYRHSLRHATRALKAAELANRQDDIKNALYLLGEGANLLGNEDEARANFSRLEKFFPETPFLTDFLLATDIRQMVNLRA